MATHSCESWKVGLALVTALAVLVSAGTAAAAVPQCDGKGATIYRGSGYAGTTGADGTRMHVTGTSAADVIVGDSGNDTLTGDGGANEIKGGDGSDDIGGAAGKGTLSDGSGDDVAVNGGDDNDK